MTLVRDDYHHYTLARCLTPSLEGGRGPTIVGQGSALHPSTYYRAGLSLTPSLLATGQGSALHPHYLLGQGSAIHPPFFTYCGAGLNHAPPVLH